MTESNLYNNIINLNKSVYIQILIPTFIVLLFISPDSYLYDLWNREDTAWFFLNAKAWANGATPYVDFADSKGPLLYLIYRIGYTISNCNYIGIFWISVFWWTGIFWFLYKTANIFIADKHKSTIAAILMMIAEFCPFFHREFRAEDLAMLFVAISLYATCCLLYNKHKSTKDIYINSFLLGLSLSGTFLIKYSITAMIGIFIIFSFVYIINKRENILKSIIFFLAGVLILCVPFIVYMLATNSLQAFFHEYIINTLFTVKNAGGVKTSIQEIAFMLLNPSRFSLLLFGIIGNLMFTRLVTNYKMMPLISFLWFMLLSSKHTSMSLNISPHYYQPPTIFAIFLIICIMLWFKDSLNRRWKSYAIVIATFLFVVPTNLLSFTYDTPLMPDLFIYDRQYRKQYYDIAWLMSEVNNPTYILWSWGHETGLGVPVNSLPGSKYTPLQTGATDEMTTTQMKDIESRRSDFIVIVKDKDFENKDKILLSLGYKPYYTYLNSMWHDYQVLYSKHELTMPPTGFHVTNTDILLKRNFQNIKSRFLKNDNH